MDDDNATYVLQLIAVDHGDPPRSAASPLTMTFVVGRLVGAPASRGTAAGRRRAGAPLLDGWVPVAVAAACAVGLVLLCTVLAVLACVLRRRRRRRRDCAKRHQNVDAAAAVPLTGKYNCRVESLKIVGDVRDASEGSVKTKFTISALSAARQTRRVSDRPTPPRQNIRTADY